VWLHNGPCRRLADPANFAWRSDPVAGRDEKEWDDIGPVNGIVIYLHEDCDPVRLEFDRDLYVQEFIKRQFADVEMNIKVLKLLKAIEPFFCILNVEDESEWWETRDTARSCRPFCSSSRCHR
jgi:hypothetical protein